jgi:CheY-like chemotaxis protein
LVLIADDDDVTRAVVEAWLVGAGYEVIAAADGDAALALALESPTRPAMRSPGCSTGVSSMRAPGPRSHTLSAMNARFRAR